MKIGRNDLCPCGSGFKYKKCHMLIEAENQRIENFEWEAWFAKDQAQGKENLAAIKEKTVKPV